MPRLASIEDVLFPVAEHPLFVRVKIGGGIKQVPVAGRRAIVRSGTLQVVGVVARDYRLVTHKQALEWALACCRAAFPETSTGEWQVGGVDAPGTGSYCFIDLKHNSAALDFDFAPVGERPEIYGPFIRVTNSYNGARALRFDIGFYRKVCSNGLIGPDVIISFDFPHSRRRIPESISFKIDQAKLAGFKASFQGLFTSLRSFPVQRRDFEPLARKVLMLRDPVDDETGDADASGMTKLNDVLAALCGKYAGEIGENAYAVFNVITDLASNPPDVPCLRRERHSLQRFAGAWLGDFTAACRTPGFSLADYLHPLGVAEGGTGSSRFGSGPP